jgi:hypothetical protein
MNNTEWLGMYIGGCILSLFFTLTGTGDRIYAEDKSSRIKKILFGLFSIFCWPILLPLSFLVLWTTICFFGFFLGLFILRLIKCEVKICGTTPALFFAKNFPDDVTTVPTKV